MDTQKIEVAPAFAGSKANQKLAERVFGVFRARGAFFSDSAPIRLSITQLVEFLDATEGPDNWSSKVDKALTASPDVFLREEADGDVFFTTTKQGKASVDVLTTDDEPNNLKTRFATPEPVRETARPRRVLESTGESSVIETGDQAFEKSYAPDSWQAAVAAALREAQARDQGVPGAIDEPAGFNIEDLVDLSEAAADMESDEPSVEDLEEILIDEQPVDLVATPIDLSNATDDELISAIKISLESDPDIARWGDLWMHESKVARLSRGDLRKAQEYIDENGEPLGDVELVQDLRSVNAGSPDFPLERFTVNFRLSREVRDFEYLGTSTEGLWATTNMPGVGSEKRKASELGQDYRFLTDYQNVPDGLEEGIVEHVLTFYEYQYGVLPLDASIGSIMPKPAFADQRAARLTMEAPQTGETFTIELRFPTGNRGGYIVGLDAFFEENLVPGALVTIEATENPRHFIIEYFQMSGQDRRLLSIDARKNRYVFKPTTFYCGLQDDMLVDENRFPRLADAEPLDERTRRRPEQVVARTFERVGENVGSATEPRWSATLLDLLAAANVERPISADFLRDILTGGAYPEFSTNDDEEDAFFYQP